MNDYFMCIYTKTLPTKNIHYKIHHSRKRTTKHASYNFIQQFELQRVLSSSYRIIHTNARLQFMIIIGIVFKNSVILSEDNKFLDALFKTILCSFILNLYRVKCGAKEIVVNHEDCFVFNLHYQMP